MSKQRIFYIDLAKGLCMLLIVMVHCGVPELFKGLYTANVVLFFLLSGYFYHDEIPMQVLIEKKIRTLLIPFIIFYIFSYSIFYAIYCLYPSFLSYTEARGILDVFTQKQYFNGPIWFLLSLFEIQLFVFFIRRLFKEKSLYQWICYVTLFVTGYGISILNIDLPLNIDSSLTCSIFFATGIFLKETGKTFEQFNNINKIQAFVLCLSLYLIYLFNPVNCWISYNRYDCNNIIELFIILLVVCLFKILFCKVIATSKLSFLSFTGKHTMYILCMHHLIYRPIKLICNNFFNMSDIVSSCIVFVLTTAICLFSATWVENKLPWAFGIQKKKLTFSNL